MTKGSHDIPRRLVLTRIGSAVFAMSAMPGTVRGQGTGPAIPKRPAPLAADLVQRFVVAAHADMTATRALLGATPGLLNATWDWGGGDFETAIGGAGHMGNRAIAEFLLGEGARMDVFVAAMLGRLDVVRAILTVNPALRASKGPHGIPLLAHAKAGGPAAEPVVAFLQGGGIE